jgi:hypothetical protein
MRVEKAMDFTSGSPDLMKKTKMLRLNNRAKVN